MEHINKVSPNSGISLLNINPNIKIMQQTKNPVTESNLLLENPPEFLRKKDFQLG